MAPPLLRDLPGVLLRSRWAAGESQTLDLRLALKPTVPDLPEDGRRAPRLLLAAAAACFFLVTFASSSRPTPSLLGMSMVYTRTYTRDELKPV